MNREWLSMLRVIQYDRVMLSVIVFFSSSLVALILVYTLLYRSAKVDEAQAVQQLKHLRFSAQHAEDQKKWLESLTRHAERIDTEKQRLLKTYRNSDILVDVNRLLENSDIQVLNEAYSKPLFFDGYTASDIQLKLKGNYIDIKTFVWNVYQLSYLAAVQKVSLSQSKQEMLDAEITIRLIGTNNDGE